MSAEAEPPRLRPPCTGDVLLEPQRFVSMVDYERREFRCDPFEGSPRHHFLDDWPGSMADSWRAAPIEPGWTELPPEVG